MKKIINLFTVTNSLLEKVGSTLGSIAVALMVCAILIQVVFRYLLNNALPWPDEAARFFMLWMVGLMAPIALRKGGFVAIDMLVHLLKPRLAAILNLVLLGLATLVIVIAIQIGWKEVTGFGGRFATASLYVPTSIAFDEWFRVPRSWMMASLLIGFVWMLIVQIELILRQLFALFTGDKSVLDLSAEEA
jgi:TRAP-type C4-dicarboxylate transport system permease small subunit